MFTFFSRSSVVLAGMVVAAALGLATLGGIAFTGLNDAADEADQFTSDEVATATLAAQFALGVDRAFVTGRTLALVDPTSVLKRQLFQQQIPEVEALLVGVRRIRPDEKEEQDRVGALVEGWTAMRALLTDDRLMQPGNAYLVQELTTHYEAFNADAKSLIENEAADAGARNEAAASATGRVKWRLAGTAGAVLVILAGLGALGDRRIRRQIQPVQEQADFADTLQLTESEDEAHRLLQRRLLRVVPDGAVSILNRNNSANRLEAMTELSDAGLVDRLELAEPRACLAIRSARAHEEDPGHPGLIACGVCAPCPSFSTCTPLTVGGEVIGSVLVNGPKRTDGSARRLIRDSVSQAAPVLANLRNLAIAELRAATDSLTGLPNKRAVGDTLRRMFAQASRTASPMAVVLVDLDHFKNLNDQFGHPAGDQALASVGAAMRATLRESDFAGRNGGEEFAVILPNTDTAGAFEAAEKLRLAISRITVPGLDIDITASMGVAAYPEHALSPERLERLADAALYVAKRSGRNRVEIAEATPEAPDDLETLASQAPVAVARPDATTSAQTSLA